MRSSSIKTVVAAVSITATMLAAVPSADARTAQPRKSETARTRDAEPSSDRSAPVRELIARALRRIGIQTGATIPIPKSAPEAEE